MIDLELFRTRGHHIGISIWDFYHHSMCTQSALLMVHVYFYQLYDRYSRFFISFLSFLMHLHQLKAQILILIRFLLRQHPPRFVIRNVFTHATPIRNTCIFLARCTQPRRQFRISRIKMHPSLYYHIRAQTPLRYFEIRGQGGSTFAYETEACEEFPGGANDMGVFSQSVVGSSEKVVWTPEEGVRYFARWRRVGCFKFGNQALHLGGSCITEAVER